MDWPNSVDWSLRAAPEICKESCWGPYIYVKHRNNQVTFIKGLLYSRLYAKCFACITSDDLLVMPLLLSDSNYQGNHWDPRSH